MPMRYTLTLHQPTIAELVEISELIIKMEVTSKQLRKINLIDSYHLVNGNALLAVEALVIASRFKHPLISRKRFIKWLIKTIDAPTFDSAWEVLVLHGGVADFINTTGLILQWDSLNPQTQRSGQADTQSE